MRIQPTAAFDGLYDAPVRRMSGLVRILTSRYLIDQLHVGIGEALRASAESREFLIPFVRMQRLVYVRVFGNVRRAISNLRNGQVNSPIATTNALDAIQACFIVSTDLENRYVHTVTAANNIEFRRSVFAPFVAIEGPARHKTGADLPGRMNPLS